MLQIRFIDRVKFMVERQFVKGAAFQLLVVMLFIGLISLIGGFLVLPAGEQFEGVGEAVWWAFLRLTDPGYLGDDEGNWTRFVSTILTVSGYVVFLGALVAIMTRKLIALMNDLERGLTPVALKHHVVVLGWNSRTLPLLRELLSSSGRMRRFLERNAARKLRLVVLSEDASAAQRLELKNEAGIGRRARQVILRSGTPIQPDALKRVACLDAAAVIVPSGSQGPGSLVTSDVETVKALLSISAQAREAGAPLPFVVAELQDLRKRPVIERAYPGAVEVVGGDATISRLLAQNILHPGLSSVYNELLTAGDGNELYVRSGDAYDGKTLSLLAAETPRAIVLGLLRPGDKGFSVMLLADTDTAIEPEDRVILMARHYTDTELEAKPSTQLEKIERFAPSSSVASAAPGPHRVLILGWNRRVPSLIAEFTSYVDHSFDIELASILPAKEREKEIQRYTEGRSGVTCKHIEADYMVEGELRRLNPQSYDTVLLLSSDRLASGEEADARAMVGHLQLDDILSEYEQRPQMIMELSDPANETLLTLPHSEVMVSPIILSHLLAQVALRRELRVVFDELFTVGGAEILFREQGAYSLPADADFHTLEAAAAAKGEIALGVYRQTPDEQGKRLKLNPQRQLKLDLKSDDQLVVLAYTG